MCVYVYIHIYVCVYICVYVYACCMYIYICVYMYICVWGSEDRRQDSLPQQIMKTPNNHCDNHIYAAQPHIPQTSSLNALITADNEILLLNMLNHLKELRLNTVSSSLPSWRGVHLLRNLECSTSGHSSVHAKPSLKCVYFRTSLAVFI